MGTATARLRLSGAAVLGALLLAACSGSGDDAQPDTAADGTADDGPADAGGAGEAEQTGPRYAAEPSAVLVDQLLNLGSPVVLHEGSAFVVSETDLTVFDLAGGRETGRPAPENPVLYVGDPVTGRQTEESRVTIMEERRRLSTPVVGEIDGTAVVATAFPVELDEGPGIEVVVVAADSGEVHRRMTYRSPRWADSPPRGVGNGHVLGIHDGALIVEERTGKKATGTVALSAEDGSVLWERDDLDPYFVSGGYIVGGERDEDGETGPWSVFTAADGELVRTAAATGADWPVTRAGPWALLSTPNGDEALLIDIADGSPVASTDDGLPASPTCVEDSSAGVLICGARAGGGALALDTGSGEELWRFAVGDEDRWLLPGTAHDGRFYAQEDDSPTAFPVLDSRTGEPLGADSPIMPFAANEHGAVVYRHYQLALHPVAEAA